MMAFDSCFGNFNKKNFKLNYTPKIMSNFLGCNLYYVIPLEIFKPCTNF